MKTTIKLLFLPLMMLCLTVGMFLFPNATYEGARSGLETWALTLAPSLLPFMIAADILLELGVVGFLGVLLEPLMRPIFKQPGEAGFVVALGFTSGFPMGAILTNALYGKNILTKNEATRLITYTNNASPLFLLVAVPVGMLGAPHLGLILLTAHYLANLSIGVLGGLFTAKEVPAFSGEGHIFKRSIEALFKCRRNTPPFGTVLTNAVTKSIKSILSIGGFVLFFSVTIEILKTVNFFAFTNKIFAHLLMFFHCDPALSQALSCGFLEMTLGAKAASVADSPLFFKVIIISFILGWSGLSIHTQVGSIIQEQNLPLLPYSFCRLLQSFLAAAITALLLIFLPDTTVTFLSSLSLESPPHLLGFMLMLPFVNLLWLLLISALCFLIIKLKKIVIIH